jgi:glycosyltransferase involved in cell wall biosynthesis
VATSLGTLVIAGTFDGRGGLERQTRALVLALAEQAPVTVITWNSKRPRVELDAPSVSIVRLPAPAPLMRNQPAAMAWPNTALRIGTGAVAALARRNSYNSILAIGLNPEGLVAALVGRILRKPFVLYAWTSAASWGSVRLLERSPFERLWQRMLCRARAYVAQTEEVAGDLARLGFRSDRIHVVPVGIEMEAFSPAAPEARARAKKRLGVDGAHVALYHGRFDLGQKRLDLLISAWQSAKLAGWRLVLAGDGPDARRVRELARRLDPPAVFVEWQDDVRWLLDAADLAVLPTNSEGTSGALAEAMAYGLPVLASRVPSHDRMRPDGVVMVPNEREAWTSALLELAGDADRRATFGSLARGWVETRFDARMRVAAYANLLDSHKHADGTA